MVWLCRSLIPVGREMLFYLPIDTVLPPSFTVTGKGGDITMWLRAAFEVLIRVKGNSFFPFLLLPRLFVGKK
jgi:hypothetical protein